MLTRRGFFATTAAVPMLLQRREAEIPLVDYHVHLDERSNMTLDRALALSRERGVKFGIVEHAGTKDKPYRNIISNDGALERYIAALDGKPVLKGIQAEGLDWMTCFTPALVAQLDYVLSDALTLPEKDGSFTELWRPNVRVDDAEAWMERYIDFNVQVIAREPIDILANPLYLPDCLADRYDALWTRDRMLRIAEAAAEHRVAIELNERYRLPRLAFLKLAREAGVKFSMGSNHHNGEVGIMGYTVEMIRTLHLKPADMFKPALYGRKPVQVRKF